MTSRPVILSLCDFTGNWSRPYEDAGYDVQRVDIQRGVCKDVRLLPWNFGAFDGACVHGILAAPPCTHFARSGAQYWEAKGEAALIEALSIVDACMRAVVIYRPRWWALENPIGRLKDYIGPPSFKFDPCDFGDPWTKRTWLWGNFAPPVGILAPVGAVEPTMGDITTKGSSSKNRRSATPAGFASAFFAANP